MSTKDTIHRWVLGIPATCADTCWFWFFLSTRDTKICRGTVPGISLHPARKSENASTISGATNSVHFFFPSISFWVKPTSSLNLVLEREIFVFFSMIMVGIPACSKSVRYFFSDVRNSASAESFFSTGGGIFSAGLVVIFLRSERG